MNHINLRSLKRYDEWDGTRRLPHELAVGYDPNWDAFYAQLSLGGDKSLPHVRIGMAGYDGAKTVEELAAALKPYAHLPRWAVTSLLAERALTDAETRNEARARSESAAALGIETPQVEGFRSPELLLEAVGHSVQAQRAQQPDCLVVQHPSASVAAPERSR